MSEKKMVSRNVAIALGVICIILAAGYGVVILHFTSVVSDRDKTIGSLNNQVAGLITDTANLTSALSSLTTEVSALNSSIVSLQGQIESSSSSSLVLYGTYSVSWGQNDTGDYSTLSSMGYLPVANYSTMSVFFQFENVTAEYEEWNAIWAPLAVWVSDPTTGATVSYGTLPFSMSPVSFGETMLMGVYPIKAPYVWLDPELINAYDCGFCNQFSPQADQTAFAILEIYVDLSRNETSLQQETMKEQNIRMIHDTLNATNMAFGPYWIEGFSEVYVQMVSNVSCSVVIDDTATPYVRFDSFNLTAAGVVQKSYLIPVDVDEIRFDFSTVAPVPWDVYVNVYLMP
jgi:hypothetical protein